jgi:DNA-binding transcriptional LysR family regulator
MELQHLHYLQAVASSGSMTSAAKSLGVSQPTLTVAIRQLEESLGTKLFLRERSGVRLTSTGEVFLEHAASILAQIERAEQEVKDLETDEVGDFVIGCHESLGAYFLPEFMSSFLREAPRIKLDLWNGTSTDVQAALVDRKVHFGLVVNPRPHPSLVVRPLFRDAVDFFISSATESSSDLEAAHRHLREGPLVFAGRVFQCQELVERIAAQQLLPRRTLACGDLELVKSLALAGVGVALLPRRVAAYDRRASCDGFTPRSPSSRTPSRCAFGRTRTAGAPSLASRTPCSGTENTWMRAIVRSYGCH